MSSVLTQVLGCHEYKDNCEVSLCIITHDTDNFQQEMQKLFSLYYKCLSYVKHYMEKYWERKIIKYEWLLWGMIKITQNIRSVNLFSSPIEGLVAFPAALKVAAKARFLIPTLNRISLLEPQRITLLLSYPDSFGTNFIKLNGTCNFLFCNLNFISTPLMFSTIIKICLPLKKSVRLWKKTTIYIYIYTVN